MKIGVVGKGGAGKTTISSLLARALAERGQRVLAVDTDSNPNLGLSLGLDLAATEAVPTVPRSMIVGARGDVTVDELMDEYAVTTPAGVTLMSALRVAQAGAGCTCGGHATVRSLLAQVLDGATDHTVIDMEAGIEHLSRSGGTLAHADVLVIVVEPTTKAVITAERTVALAAELGIARCLVWGNKLTEGRDHELITLCGEHGLEVDGIVPASPEVMAAERRGELLSRDAAPAVWAAIDQLADHLDPVVPSLPA